MAMPLCPQNAGRKAAGRQADNAQRDSPTQSGPGCSLARRAEPGSPASTGAHYKGRRGGTPGDPARPADRLQAPFFLPQLGQSWCHPVPRHKRGQVVEGPGRRWIGVSGDALPEWPDHIEHQRASAGHRVRTQGSPAHLRPPPALFHDLGQGELNKRKSVLIVNDTTPHHPAESDGREVFHLRLWVKQRRTIMQWGTTTTCLG